MTGEYYNKAFKKLEHRLNKYIKEYKLRIKDKDEREIEEEVFDESTLKTLYILSNQNIIYEFYGVVATGKESRIYAGKSGDGEPIAIKIFLIHTSEFRRGRLKYIMGDERFEGLSRAPHKLIYVWAQKEYKNLLKASKAKVYVPRPIACLNNVLVMEFIGDDFKPAPLLRELREVSGYMLYQVLRQAMLLYRKAELIHTDLSEYNIFYYKRKPVLFDFGQAVLKTHPQADAFLVRDIGNILNFFRGRGVDVDISIEEAIEYVKGG